MLDNTILDKENGIRMIKQLKVDRIIKVFRIKIWQRYGHTRRRKNNRWNPPKTDMKAVEEKK